MENRKELSEKSKKLIAKQFKSDILNKSTGYYKTENIYPIASKPNEFKIKLEKFVPHFKEEKAVERHFYNLLSEKQRNNSFILKHKKLLPYKDEELEIKRKRNKTIKDNCYDKKGNFSSKRRYILEFYGIELLNKTFENIDINNNNIIQNETDINKEKEKENRKDNNINKVKHKFNNSKKNKIRELIMKNKNRNLDSNYNKIDSSIKLNNEEIFNDVNNNNIENNSFFKNFNETKYNKITRNRNKENNLYNTNISSYTNKATFQNTISNITNPTKFFNRKRTDIHYPGDYLNKTQTNNLKNYFHSKDITKLFYTNSNNPVNIRLKKNEINKDNIEHYNLEFKLKNNDIKLLENLTQKNIKEIFYRNGLHVYDINEDCMNILETKKKMEAKLRKKINEENFENNYKKTVKILGKKGIIVDIEKISDEKGFQNIIIKKKRKGTPGKVLYDNRFHKDENTKINTGNKNYNFKKRGKNILPQYDRNYKNYFKYKQKQLKK